MRGRKCGNFSSMASGVLSFLSSLIFITIGMQLMTESDFDAHAQACQHLSPLLPIMNALAAFLILLNTTLIVDNFPPPH